MLLILCGHPDHSCVQVTSVIMACVVFIWLCYQWSFGYLVKICSKMSCVFDESDVLGGQIID